MKETCDPGKTEVLKKLCEMGNFDRKRVSVLQDIAEFAKIYKASVTPDTSATEVVQIINFFEFRGKRILVDEIDGTFVPTKTHLIKDKAIKLKLEEYSSFAFSQIDEQERKKTLAQAILNNPQEEYFAIAFTEAEIKGARENEQIKRLTETMAKNFEPEGLLADNLKEKTVNVSDTQTIRSKTFHGTFRSGK